MALEAYQEIKGRYDFINGQKNDLFNAKQSLLNTIAEIDAVARETFMNAFNQIRQNFIKVFRSLFSEEDSCDLKLVNPDNPLESAIEIMAKPKGKRPLTINQLSGGEKTLTATSLLFAIYLLKPAPFCIFDEVDAPLDDANIDKFNHIVRKFSGESQFIIVTHNKRTMAATDIIYGITQPKATSAYPRWCRWICGSLVRTEKGKIGGGSCMMPGQSWMNCTKHRHGRFPGAGRCRVAGKRRMAGMGRIVAPLPGGG
jgi:chromosome segregation protein